MRLKHVIVGAMALGLMQLAAWAQEPTTKPDAGPSLKPGSAAPALTVGKWVKGEPVKELEKGKIYVLEYWATWCPPCRQTIPHVSELQKKYKDVVFIGVDCFEEDDSKVEPFVQKMGDKMDYRVVLDDKETDKKGKMASAWMEAAGQSGIPCAFIVDKDSKIAWIGHPMGMEAVLEKVVAGKFDLAKEVAFQADARKIQEDLQAAAEKQDWDKVVSLLDDFATSHADNTDVVQGIRMTQFNVLLTQKKDAAAAYALAGKIADQYKDQPMVLGALSWTIMQAEGVENRNIDLALKLATQAAEASKYDDARILDTLARANFEKGNTDKAIEYQTQAVAKNKDDQLKDLFQANLDKYKEKQAMPATTQPSAPAAPAPAKGE